MLSCTRICATLVVTDPACLRRLALIIRFSDALCLNEGH